MYTNILIPTDGSELAGNAVQHGIALAKRLGAKVTVLTVLLPFHTFKTDPHMIEDTQAQYKARIQEHAQKTLGVVALAAQAAGVVCETVQVEHEHPYQAIVDTAGSKGCDLIVNAAAAPDYPASLDFHAERSPLDSSIQNRSEQPTIAAVNCGVAFPNINLRTVPTPRIGIVLDAPPALRASDNSVNYTCGACATILLHAEEHQVRGLLIHCTNCGAYNSTDAY